jgi:hypothetical protein
VVFHGVKLESSLLNERLNASPPIIVGAPRCVVGESRATRTLPVVFPIRIGPERLTDGLLTSCRRSTPERHKSSLFRTQ